MLKKINKGNILMLQRVTMFLAIFILAFSMITVNAAQITVGAKTDITVTGTTMQYLAMKGDQYLFAAGNTPATGIRLFDLTTNLEVVNDEATNVYRTFSTKSNARQNIIISGNYLYAIQYTSGSPSNFKLRKIDITIPTNPILLQGADQMYDFGGIAPADMDIVGNRLYVGVEGTNNNAIHIFNIEGDKAIWLHRASFKLNDGATPSGNYFNTKAISVANGYIYSVNNLNIGTLTGVPATATRIVDIVKLNGDTIDETSWVRYTTVLPINASTTAKLSDIIVDGDYAYVSIDDSAVGTSTLTNNGLVVLNISDLSNITSTFIKTDYYKNRVNNIEKKGNIIFASNTGQATLIMFDVSNPDNMVALPSAPHTTSKTDIVVGGNTVVTSHLNATLSKIPINTLVDVVISPFSSKITTASYTISGTSTAGATPILLTVGLDPVIKQVTPDASGNWSYLVTGATNGDHVITAQIKDVVPDVLTKRTANVELVGAPGVITIGDPEFSVANVANGDITATMTVNNPIDAVSTQNVTLILALYYDGALIQADADSITVQKTGLDTSFSSTVTIPATLPMGYTLNKYSVRAFVWDDFTSVKSLKIPFDLSPASL